MTGVRAHLDPSARESAEALEARAYTTGNDVAFARSPDLFTAAHEAAHVVQQVAGVHLASESGCDHDQDDACERHADAVAEKVVQGQSAEQLLDEAPTGVARVQRKPDDKPARIEKHVGPIVIGGAFAAYIRMGLEGQINASIAAAKLVRVNVVSDAAFRQAWGDYCERKDVPRQEPPDNLNGFVDPEHPEGQMGFVREAAGFGTIVHETMHQLASPEFRDAWGRAMNEGTTELFTRVVLARNQAGIERVQYPDEVAAMQKLQSRCGLPAIGEMYFAGDASAVIAKIGRDRFFQFTQAMGNEDPVTAAGVLGS